MLEARDVDDLSVEDLRAEVWFWRENTAAELAARLGSLEAMDSGALRRSGINRVRKRVASLADRLREALRGDYWCSSCEPCGLPVKPGQAVISDVDLGDMHADCANGGDGRYKPGDKVFMDPEGIVWEGEGPKPDHIVCHASERLYTTARLAETVGRAFARLAGSKAT